MTTLDDLRAKYPHLGFAIYAYEPGGDVTLECHTPSGEVFTFTGPTADAAIQSGFADEEPAPAPAPEPVSSVFD